MSITTLWDIDNLCGLGGYVQKNGKATIQKK